MHANNSSIGGGREGGGVTSDGQPRGVSRNLNIFTSEAKSVLCIKFFWQTHRVAILSINTSHHGEMQIKAACRQKRKKKFKKKRKKERQSEKTKWQQEELGRAGLPEETQQVTGSLLLFCTTLCPRCMTPTVQKSNHYRGQDSMARGDGMSPAHASTRKEKRK